MSRPRWFIVTGLALCASVADAATLPAGFTESRLAMGIPRAAAMAFAVDGRLFVCEQGPNNASGTANLRIVKDGALLSTPFLSLTVDSQGERGLLGVTFHPAFTTTDPYVYVYYTVPGSPPHNRVSRFLANGDVASGPEDPILDLENLSGATNHNGGAIHFGPDGKLYVAVGDNANSGNSQVLSNRLGKVLRLNPDGTIPGDNPFFGTASGDNRAIWALGLRNPFTFGFQPGTGRLFVNDVGSSASSAREEINDGIAGSNYGWPIVEGIAGNPLYVDPLLAYAHGSANNQGCAIVGAAFYNTAIGQYPAEFAGDYFFADHCNGWTRRFDPAVPGTSTLFATGISNPVDLAIGAQGDLHYLTRGGSVFRVSTDALFEDGFE